MNIFEVLFCLKIGLVNSFLQLIQKIDMKYFLNIFMMVMIL